jgi:nucleoside-diphosphate-sugar epimerase
MGRIFVTGAGGQIGLPLVRALVARGHSVAGLVRNPAKAEAVRQAGAEVVEGGLDDAAALAKGLEGAGIVYHLAGGARGKGAETADVMNRVGTESLIAACRGRKLQAFVFASTMAIYGDRSSMWIPEDYPPNPQTNYGKSKVEAETALLAAWTHDALPVRIARIAAVYGPGITFMAEERIKGGKAWLPGEGKNHVPVVHVKDCVEALIAIAERGKDGEIYHVAGKSTPMLKEFYAEVHRHVGGTPMRFWSTWVPSFFQYRGAAINEQVCTRIGRKPRFTADNLRLYTASIRLRTDRLEKELGFTWSFPDHKVGVAEACGGAPPS